MLPPVRAVSAGRSLHAHGFIRECHIVRLTQAGEDLVDIVRLIVISQLHGALFQSALAVVRPDIGIALFVKADKGAAQRQAVQGLGRFLLLYGQVDMLPQKHIVAAVQLHIEGVLGGIAHIIGRAGYISAAAALVGILIIHQGNGARPEFIGVCAGCNAHAISLHNSAPLHLIQHALDAEGTGLLDGDVNILGVSVFIGLVIAQGSDSAVHRRSDHGIGQQML